jgi:hypothetical protein
MAAGTDYRHFHRRLHSYSSCHRHRDDFDENHFWKENGPVNTKTLVAIVLIALGIVVLAYSGLSFTTPGKPIEFLGLHVETTESHFIPPFAGAIALGGGILLLVIKPRKV